MSDELYGYHVDDEGILIITTDCDLPPLTHIDKDDLPTKIGLIRARCKSAGKAVTRVHVRCSRAPDHVYEFREGAGGAEYLPVDC